MKRLPDGGKDEWAKPVGFEILEARLLLDGGAVAAEGEVRDAVSDALGAPEVHAPAGGESAAPQAPVGPAGADDVWEPVCGVDGRTYGSAAAGEPTSLTFNGRGIDLNEDAKVDALASAGGTEGDQLYKPEGRDIDLLLIGKVLSDGASAEGQAARDEGDEKITPYEQAQLAPSDQMPVTLAYEPGWSFGAQAYLRGRVVDALTGGGAGVHLDVGYEDGKLKLGSFAQDDDIVFLRPEFNPYEQIDADDDGVIFPTPQFSPYEQAAGAGHCKIMAVRVANPESSFAAGGPLGAVMGGIGSVMGQGFAAGGPLGAVMGGIGAVLGGGGGIGGMLGGMLG
jgi:hypothetical protein